MYSLVFGQFNRTWFRYTFFRLMNAFEQNHISLQFQMAPSFPADLVRFRRNHIFLVTFFFFFFSFLLRIFFLFSDSTAFLFLNALFIKVNCKSFQDQSNARKKERKKKKEKNDYDDFQFVFRAAVVPRPGYFLVWFNFFNFHSFVSRSIRSFVYISFNLTISIYLDFSYIFIFLSFLNERTNLSFCCDFSLHSPGTRSSPVPIRSSRSLSHRCANSFLSFPSRLVVALPILLRDIVLIFKKAKVSQKKKKKKKKDWFQC